MDFRLKPLDLQARNVFCIGRNYAQHVKEMGNAPPKEPVLFLKPTSALCCSGTVVRRPTRSHQVDHEVELVIALGQGGKSIAIEKALDCVAGYAVGIDITARDLQHHAKQQGLPWLLSKGFDTFAPVSDFVPRAEGGDGPFDLSLQVNGQVRQKGNTGEMIFTVAYLIHYLSCVFTLAPGDLVFTGTPAGVGPLLPQDRVVAKLGALASLEVRIE